jgi:lipid-binding SYLF domain-containing protein
MALSATPVVAAGLQDDVNQAATIIERFQAVPEKGIPRTVLKDAKGLAILTVIKAGFGFRPTVCSSNDSSRVLLDQ